MSNFTRKIFSNTPNKLVCPDTINIKAELTTFTTAVNEFRHHFSKEKKKPKILTDVLHWIKTELPDDLLIREGEGETARKHSKYRISRMFTRMVRRDKYKADFETYVAFLMRKTSYNESDMAQLQLLFAQFNKFKEHVKKQLQNVDNNSKMMFRKWVKKEMGKEILKSYEQYAVPATASPLHKPPSSSVNPTASPHKIYMIVSVKSSPSTASALSTSSASAAKAASALPSSVNKNDRKWFEFLFKIEESDLKRDNISTVESDKKRMQLTINGVDAGPFEIGHFTTPNIQALQIANKEHQNSETTETRVVHLATSSILSEHSKEENMHATFQAASQYNALEFDNDSVTPEYGIARYAGDNTQGPDCALACAAGTLYRNYARIMPNDQKGQSADNQINYLDDLVEILRTNSGGVLTVPNGYTKATDKDLQSINEYLINLDETQRDDLIKVIKIGVQEDVGVTFSSREPWTQTNHADPPYVTQVYAAAPAIGYATTYEQRNNNSWDLLSKLLLDSQYEGTIRAAYENKLRHYPKFLQANKVHLTFLGGGVFGNKIEYIMAAIARAVKIAETENMGLEIVIDHYGEIDDYYKGMLDRLLLIP